MVVRVVVADVDRDRLSSDGEAGGDGVRFGGKRRILRSGNSPAPRAQFARGTARVLRNARGGRGE
jgi:hypothetical protein